MNDVTKRFIEVYNYLVTDNKVSGQKDFACKIGVSTSMITEILKGRSNVGLSAIQNTVLQFDIDSNWLFTGFGYISSNNQLKEPSENYSKGIIETQQETIETQKKYILHLEAENARLKDEKEKPAEGGQKRKVV